MEFILASSSPRRRELLKLLDIEPLILTPSIKEHRKDGETIEAFVKRIAIAKGKNVYKDDYFEVPLISADTVVYCDRRLIGKPTTRSEAFQFLTFLSGRVHVVLTGISIIYQGITTYDLARTNVEFVNIRKSEIDHYLDNENYMDKAGAYAIQGKASVFVRRIDGCFFNVMGFPLNLFYSLLKKIGVNIWA
jgi:septum formation protein